MFESVNRWTHRQTGAGLIGILSGELKIMEVGTHKPLKQDKIILVSSIEVLSRKN